MAGFDNYVCDGQMELDDIYPKTCCGLVPWLHKTRCCRWSEDKPQKWMVYYICPKCYKRAVDETGWAIFSHGTFEEAKADALAIWNDPNIKKEVCEVTKKQGFNLQIALKEPEEWEQLYGVDLQGSYKGKL